MRVSMCRTIRRRHRRWRRKRPLTSSCSWSRDIRCLIRPLRFHQNQVKVVIVWLTLNWKKKTKFPLDKEKFSLSRWVTNGAGKIRNRIADGLFPMTQYLFQTCFLFVFLIFLLFLWYEFFLNIFIVAARVTHLYAMEQTNEMMDLLVGFFFALFENWWIYSNPVLLVCVCVCVCHRHRGFSVSATTAAALLC